jgi:hypothetical protein
MRAFARAMVWGFILAAGASPAAAQTGATTADLTGAVRDVSDAVLPGVVVTATNTATNVSRSATTDGEGRYTIPALPPGSYDVVAELAGFAPERREGVVLALGTAVTIDLTLQVAGATEAVTVSTQAPLVDTTATAVSNVVSQQQIESLPINGRNFISFAVITPGVSTDQTPQQGASATSGLTFAGQRGRSNNISVDGLDNNDPTVGSVRATFSQEAVREFQVLTNSFSAEFGKASGGVVNIITRSGSNIAQGTLFFYARDDALNAKSHFEKFDPAGNEIDLDKAPYAQKQYGGVLGGPIRKDRTFFFTSFERLDIDTNNLVTIDNRTPVRVLGQDIGTAVDILNRAGFPVEVGNVPYRVDTNAFLAKVDHQLAPAQTLSLRYNYGDAVNENIEPWGGQVARSRGARLESTDHMFAASHGAVISNRVVNELRFQFARRDQLILSLDPTCGGPCLSEDVGGPTAEVIGFASVGRQRFTPQPRLNERYQILDTASLYAGKHQLKAGVDFNYIDHVEQALPLHFGGRYIFTGFNAQQAAQLGLPGPITAIQAFALGIPARYVQGYGNSSQPYGSADLALFLQDDWRVAEHATLKLGVRYQMQFWPEVTYRVNGVPDPYDFPSDRDNIAPRLGFAWDPTGDGRTSIHAAYGLFYDNHITSMIGITDIVDGDADGLRTLVVGPPVSVAAWRRPSRRLTEQEAVGLLGGPYPSLEIAMDPDLETPYAHHASVGVDRELGGGIAMSASFVYARGYEQVGTIDYNPIIPALGPNRRPLDRIVGGVPIAGSSQSVLQYTSVGETWYRGLTLTLSKRFDQRTQFLASYTLSKAEDNSTDYQTAFIPEDNGRGRDPNDVAGLPIGFDPLREKGPSLQDQRHRFVLSGLVVAPGDIHVSSIVTLASGRPYNILAGADLNGDGDGGTFPPDRARTTPTDPSTSVMRNLGTLPTQATVDLRVSRRFPIGPRIRLEGLFEVFNLFNRTNYIEVNNIFGPGAYPDSPIPTFGQFTQAGPPLQMQIAARVLF